jgi:DNA-binding PadR family transcriptional regulator
MNSMTNAELAILGLILEQPRHGYEIEQVIEERGTREWTEIAFSSIYYILRKLEQKRLIRSQISKGLGKGPARRVYSINARGKRAWHEATVSVLSMPATGSDSFLLGLAGLPSIPGEKSIAALHDYRDELRQRRDHVKSNWRDSGENLPLFLDGMFDFSVSMLEARIKWVERFISRMEREPNEDGQFRLPLSI